MTAKRFLITGLGGLWLAMACRSGQNPALSPPDSGGGTSPGSDAGSPPGDDAGLPPDAGIDASIDAGSMPDARPVGGGGNTDPNPSITFTQVGMASGINRSNEPASAGPFDPKRARLFKWIE